MDVVIRPLQRSDAHSLAHWANDPAVAQYLTDGFPSPYRLQHAEAFIEGVLSGDARGQLVAGVTVHNQVVGTVGLTRQQDVHRLVAELGYFIGRDFWGQGIMSRAVGQICRQGFASWNIVRIQAEVFVSNPASFRVLEKNGFRRDGILRSAIYKGGQVMDSHLFSLLRHQVMGQQQGAAVTY